MKGAVYIFFFFFPPEEGLCSRLSACKEPGCFEKLLLILDRLGMELVTLCDDLSLERRDAATCG